MSARCLDCEEKDDLVLNFKAGLTRAIWPLSGWLGKDKKNWLKFFLEKIDSLFKKMLWETYVYKLLHVSAEQFDLVALIL